MYLGLIAMKGYVILPRAPELEPHHEIQCHTQEISFGRDLYSGYSHHADKAKRQIMKRIIGGSVAQDTNFGQD